MKNNINNLFSSERSLALLVLLIVVAICTPFISPGAGASPNGEQIFKENCASCHNGGGNLVDPKKPIKGSAKLASEDKFKEYLLKPTGSMLAVPKIANDTPALDALYKYCKTLK